MTERTRPFSIFLLKDGFDATNALVEDHGMQQAAGATETPDGSTLFIADNERKRP